MIKLLVDGVVFQGADARPRARWHAILSRLQHDARIDLTVLDRGGLPHLPRAVALPFPDVSGSHRGADSLQIGSVCAHLGIDAFISTGDTTPLNTPTLQVLSDLLPQLLPGRDCGEQDLATLFARRHLCMAESVMHDLLSLRPSIDPTQVTWARFGIDHDVFRVRPRAEVDAFVLRQGIDRPYVTFGGLPEERLPGDERDAARVLTALVGAGFDVVCIDGTAPAGVACSRLRPGDGGRITERAMAYNAAVAAVEWPVDGTCQSALIEALACGCPLITGASPSVESTCAAAALQIGRDAAGGLLAEDLQALVDLVGEGDRLRRQALQHDGLLRAAAFDWDRFVHAMTESVIQLVEQARTGRFEAFLADWARLRRMQANVDFAQ